MNKTKVPRRNRSLHPRQGPRVPVGKGYKLEVTPKRGSLNGVRGAMRTVLVRAAAGTSDDAGFAPQPRCPSPDRHRVCVVHDRLMTGPAISYEFAGRTYYCCSERCRSLLETDPARFTCTRDPVTDDRIDKAVAHLLAVGGRVFFFATAEARNHFNRDPDRYLNNRRTL